MNMVKEHIDKLKLYWELIDQTDLEPEITDFVSEESLDKAIEYVKEHLSKKVTPNE